MPRFAFQLRSRYDRLRADLPSFLIVKPPSVSSLCVLNAPGLNIEFPLVNAYPVITKIVINAVIMPVPVKHPKRLLCILPHLLFQEGCVV